MRLSSGFRNAFLVLATLAGVGFASSARADNCSIQFEVLKAGWVIGGSGGSGTLFCQGRSYPIRIGGLSAGFVFGGSATRFRGSVSNIRSPYDVAGVYGAVGAGAAVGPGVQAIVLRNDKGAVLRLTGAQVGLQINADLSGLAISMR